MRHRPSSRPTRRKTGSSGWPLLTPSRRRRNHGCRAACSIKLPLKRYSAGKRNRGPGPTGTACASWDWMGWLFPGTSAARLPCPWFILTAATTSRPPSQKNYLPTCSRAWTLPARSWHRTSCRRSWASMSCKILPPARSSILAISKFPRQARRAPSRTNWRTPWSTPTRTSCASPRRSSTTAARESSPEN